MRKTNLLIFAVIVVGIAGYIAIAVLFLGKFRTPTAPPEPKPVEFRPPTPDEAPPDIRNAVLLGYDIMMETRTYAPAYVGNKLTCSNCHFQAGLVNQSIPLVGVAAEYPKYRSRTHYATNLVSRTNECFERSMNGHAAPADSREMQALQAYFAWISRDVPIYSKVPWLGVKKINSTHVPDRNRGQIVYEARCASCHSADGQGTAQAPPVWGPGSYNDGAGMSKPLIFASFVYANMPKGSPDLSVEEALDVAAYVQTKPRPHFKNLLKAAQNSDSE